ncbi:MAG: M20/M25/M40 family metallo-hydrolase [Desulfobacteraceae bacterium]|nr:M20/M25/M40 family metallo-hydrolase [Desulfobacteraceae bacterium]
MSAKSIRMIEALSNANGISGFEDEVISIARKHASKSISIKEDKLRNLYLHRKKNSGKKPVVMVDGHSDEVGFMIQRIEPNGALRFLAIGGWQPQVVMGQKVRIRNFNGEYVPGVVAAKPPHFMKPEEKNKLIDIPDMIIDVGAGSAEEVAKQFYIKPGAPVVPDVTFSMNADTGIMLGKAFDCRLGCAAVLDTLNSLAGKDLKVDLVGTFSAQEEVGLRGAKVSARTAAPDVAIIFEGTPSDDFFVGTDATQGALRKGPQIRHRDNSMITNPRFVRYARQIAENRKIPFQDAVRESGGTNGGMVNLSNQGIPVIVLGVPVRYVHSHYGFAAIDDYKGAVRWACEIITSLDKKIIAGF